MTKKYFYERNNLLLESKVNVTFEEVLRMSKDEFRIWCIELRKEIVRLWDDEGLPPVVGRSEDAMIKDMNHMLGFPTHEFLKKDESTGEFDVIRNTETRNGGIINGFFPTMMKTSINYSLDSSKGRSIYDYFAKDELLDTFITYASRHFKRDSFYNYSAPAKANDNEHLEDYPWAKDAESFIHQFEANYRRRDKWSYWLAPVDGKEYTGYNEELKGKTYLTITRQQLEQLQDVVIPSECSTNIDFSKSEVYQIRPFKLGQKLFPVGLKAFRMSFAQAPAQFPPLTAKFLYETYTEEFKGDPEVIVWDPSCGWGGRILGAMSVKDDRKILYLGTDPNEDHTTTKGRTKYHEVADFFNERTYRNASLFPSVNSFKIWQSGSEVIHENKEFQKYKGKVSLVFTSCPYFSKEGYSQDETQSFKKFSTYDLWKKGYLYKTLQTAVDWLRPYGYIVWNISDIKLGKEVIPLEKDSCDYMLSLGMQYIKTWKMGLSPMPGGNRTDDIGSTTTKNSCRVLDESGRGKSLILKYEPIFIFRKPY